MEGEKANETRIIVGLGNPGEEHENTFHNAGKRFVDFLVGEEKSWKKAKNFRYVKGDGITFVKPDVFMNESGTAVKNVLAYFKSNPEQLIVAHDDADIALGDFRIQKERGAAGHRGVASVINNLKTKNFLRVRIGIRPAGEEQRAKAGDFVLGKIGPAATKKLMIAFERIATSLKN